MKRIHFTLQDAPDHIMGVDLEFTPDVGGEYNIREENLLALLIYKHFPQLMKCNRRIKQLVVIDENGDEYKTDDFDIYGNINKASTNEKNNS